MSEFNELFDDHLFDIDEAKEKTIKLKEGERRMVSILFADIKGFTALSELLDHEDIQTLMDHIMNIFTHSVEILCLLNNSYNLRNIFFKFCSTNNIRSSIIN